MGLNKAVCAAKNVKALRPNIQLTVVEKKVDLRNPTSCSESLWGNVDLVLNALDSYEARATVHELCKIFRIPFINSGLNGTFTKNSVYVPS
jgi:molybdopterin/thiamine biosynthesis adenylyltransferase